MDIVTWFQILDKDVYISNSINTHDKDMNPSILSPVTFLFTQCWVQDEL